MNLPKKLLSLCVLASAALITSNAEANQYGNGQYCREYTETVEIGGRRESGYGTACLQPDGSWEKQGYDYNKQSYSSNNITYQKPSQTTVYIIDNEPIYNRYPTHYYHRNNYRNRASNFNISLGNSSYNSRRNNYRYNKHHYRGKNYYRAKNYYHNKGKYHNLKQYKKHR